MSDKVIFEGLALYANLPPRPAQKGYETEDTSYSVYIECSKEQFKDLKKAGIPALTQLKAFPEDFVSKKTGEAPKLKDAEGKTFIRVKATKTKTTRDGKQLEFADIPVVDEYNENVTQSIANGSKLQVIATLDDIKGKNGKALRMKGVIVTHLIAYEDDKKVSGVFAGVAKFKQKPVSDDADIEDNLFS